MFQAFPEYVQIMYKVLIIILGVLVATGSAAMAESYSDELVQIPLIWWLTPASACLGIIAAGLFYFLLLKNNPERLSKDNAKRNEKLFGKLQLQIAVTFAIATVMLVVLSYFLKILSPFVPVAFITGALFSALSGFICAATVRQASTRIQGYGIKHLQAGLKVVLLGGAVVGLIVISLGLLNISLWFWIITQIFQITDLAEISTSMLTFVIGASLCAMLTRNGSGIVSKTADYYESFCLVVVSAGVIGIAAGLGNNGFIIPMLIVAMGIFSSIIGILFIRIKEESTDQEIAYAINRGVNTALFLVVVMAYIVSTTLLSRNFGMFWSIIVGMIIGILVSKAIELYNLSELRPLQNVLKANMDSGGITGLILGMEAVVLPVLLLSLGIIISYITAGGVADPSSGLYGIALAAIGVVSVMGIYLAGHSYSVIIETSALQIADKGKVNVFNKLHNYSGISGSCYQLVTVVMAGVTVFIAYIEVIRSGLVLIDKQIIMIGNRAVYTASASLSDLNEYYQLNLFNPKFMVGLFIGGMVAFAFYTFILKSALATVKSDRPPISLIPIILLGLLSVSVGLLLGVAGTLGLIVGIVITGFIQAIIFMTLGQAGLVVGCGDTVSKSSIEEHSVRWNIVKVTALSSHQTVVKLTAILAIIFAGLTVKYSPMVMGWLNM